MAVDIALTGLAMPLGELPAIAREAETRGYRTAWIGEASGTEAIVLSTLIATHTQTLQIANGVIPVQTRTPIVYGQAAATLAHLAPGRFALGIGLSSEIIVGQWHGLPFVPSIQQMREAVQIIRMAASGERVNFEGRFYRLKNFRLGIPAPSPPPRVYLAALGPKMCELAGEVAHARERIARVVVEGDVLAEEHGVGRLAEDLLLGGLEGALAGGGDHLHEPAVCLRALGCHLVPQ